MEFLLHQHHHLVGDSPAAIVITRNIHVLEQESMFPMESGLKTYNPGSNSIIIYHNNMLI